MAGDRPFVVAADEHDVHQSDVDERLDPEIIGLVGPAGVLLATRDASPPAVGAWLERRDWDHVLLATLGSDGSVGWLAVGRSDDDDPFEPADAQLFEAIANHASVALENVRLVDELSAAAYQTRAARAARPADRAPEPNVAHRGADPRHRGRPRR